MTHLTPLPEYPNRLSLIANSGIQFLDFGLPHEPVLQTHGHFVRMTANGPLLRVRYHSHTHRFTLRLHPSDKDEVVKPEYSIPAERSWSLLANLWLPLPLLRASSKQNPLKGPDNWARFIAEPLKEQNEQGHLWRLTIAIDTRVQPRNETGLYPSPTEEDVRNGQRFAFLRSNQSLCEYLDLPWVDGWLREAYTETKHRQDDDESVRAALKTFEYQAHYLNLLAVITEHLTLPDIQLLPDDGTTEAIPVDLILDYGEGNICGLLAETSLDTPLIRVLQPRSLSHPSQRASASMSDRVIFQTASFGRPHFSRQSGRQDAFLWPSLLRVGDEAEVHASQHTHIRPNHGTSHLRNGLWDERPAPHAWHFLLGDDPAIALPMALHINDTGEPLSHLLPHQRIPVFSARYSQSALIIQLFCELLLHTAEHLNAPAIRGAEGLFSRPRRLHRIVLTTPSALSVSEQCLLQHRMDQAIRLLSEMQNGYPAGQSASPLPIVCRGPSSGPARQFLWLKSPNRDWIFDGHQTIASLDIRQTHSVLTVVHYPKTTGYGSLCLLTPTVRYSETLQAGCHDLQHLLIIHALLPAMHHLLHCPYDTGRPSEIDEWLFYPVSEALLVIWSSQTTTTPDVYSTSLGTLMKMSRPSAAQAVILKKLSPFLTDKEATDTLFQIPLQIDFSAINTLLLESLHPLRSALRSHEKLLRNIRCNGLLLSGLGSQIPALHALVSTVFALPSDAIHIQNTESMRETIAFPLSSESRLPVTSAAAGTLLAHLARQDKCPAFSLSQTALITEPRLHYFGILEDLLLPDEQVCYRNIELNDPAGCLECIQPLTLRHNVMLGFRQSADVKSPAKPLYRLILVSHALISQLAVQDALHVTLRYALGGGALVLDKVMFSDGQPVNPTDLRLELIPFWDPINSGTE